MRKIISLLLVLMLVTLPITHAAAAELNIKDTCQQMYTKDDLKAYIKHHYNAGEKEHSAILPTDKVLINPKNHCINGKHHHNQLNRDIAVARIYKIHYKCVDKCGDKWKIEINGKMGQVTGNFVCGDKLLWEKAIASPCNTYKFSHTYDLNTISDQDLTKLFNLMISVDQYMDHTQGADVTWNIFRKLAEGGTEIASTLVAIAKTGGKIPYIGEIVLIGVGIAFTVSAVIEMVEEYRVVSILNEQTVKAAETLAPPTW